MKEALDIIIRPDYFVAHNYQLLSLTEREAYDIEVAPFGVVGSCVGSLKHSMPYIHP